jgi:UDPglucose--hexose-1-phosphate uridylyltransferase
MPELRKDPIIGRWVIIAKERAKRPSDFAKTPDATQKEECPFCEGKEHLTPNEIFAVRSAGYKKDGPRWEVRVVPNRTPFLKVEGSLNRHGVGLYDVMNGIGAHEIIIETPEHIANICDLGEEQIANVLSTYIERIIDLEKDTRFKYALLFKNYGYDAGGGRFKHARSQLIATPVNPKRVKEELVGSHKYYSYHERCIFCDLIKQEIEAKERLILDIDGFVALAPFASRFPFETWILPKEHNCDFVRLNKDSLINLAAILKQSLSKLKTGLNDPPYNFVIHTAPFRRPKSGYWKTIDLDYHWHIEIIPHLTKVAGFEWGTGFYICPMAPEAAADFLRGVKV